MKEGLAVPVDGWEAGRIRDPNAFGLTREEPEEQPNQVSI